MPDRGVDYLLVGGGLASANCARWLREAGGPDSEILLVGREPDPPYNRPECSKGYLRGEESREDTYFRPDSWWEEQGIELLLRTTVSGLDLHARTAQLSTKEEVTFDKALIATGANVRRLSVDGCHLEGIHYLRSLGNADAIREAAGSAEEVVLVGGSFIATEVAASLTALGRRCTLVMQEELVLERVFGARAARFLHDSLQQKGIRIHGREDLARFEGDGRIAKVITAGGLELAADMAVVGVGVIPEIQLGRKAGLEVGERGGLRCSSRLETSCPGVYAAGDICEYSSPIHDDRPLRIEHWDVAFNHGRTAAHNMLGQDTRHETVPYFYSVLAGIGELEYVGPAYKWDEEILRGSFEEGSFTNWYLQDGRVAAALAWGRAADLDAARRLIVSKVVLDEAERTMLGDPDVELTDLGA
jgi:3-phenylpropionate/trans-cinnamate dioxygenase ferredoxin reductase subunit